MDKNFFIQIIGIVAVCFFISSIQLKNKKDLLFFQLLANIFYAIEYFLLNANVAAFMNITSVIRCIILKNCDQKNKKPPFYLLFILVTIIILLGCFNVKEIIDLIPICIVLLYTISTWQDNMKIIRILFIVASIFWIIYNIYVGAYTILIGNAFELISGIISLIRFDLKKDN